MAMTGEALQELLHAVQYRSTTERLRWSVKPPLPLFQGLGPHTQRSVRELGELTPWRGSSAACAGSVTRPTRA